MNKRDNTKNVRKKQQLARTGKNVREIAESNTFTLELTIPAEFVQKLVLNWAIASGLNVVNIREMRGRGYLISYSVDARGGTGK